MIDRLVCIREILPQSLHFQEWVTPFVLTLDVPMYNLSN